LLDQIKKQHGAGLSWVNCQIMSSRQVNIAQKALCHSCWCERSRQQVTQQSHLATGMYELAFHNERCRANHLALFCVCTDNWVSRSCHLPLDIRELINYYQQVSNIVIVYIPTFNHSDVVVWAGVDFLPPYYRSSSTAGTDTDNTTTTAVLHHRACCYRSPKNCSLDTSPTVVSCASSCRKPASRTSN
jgi:hypothetical protein